MDLNRQLNLVLNQCSSVNLQKLKLDALLIIVHHLLRDYKNINMDINSNDAEFLKANFKKLKEYLENNIITGETLSYIFQNQNQSPLIKRICINLEPMRSYYRFLTKTFSSKLEKGSHFIPEILALSLIHSYKKEYEKSFFSYSFIESFPTEKIFEIYNKNNLELKKIISKNENLSLWQIKTNLDKMYDISEIMIKKYLEFNFKINEKRVSKSRKKRR